MILFMTMAWTILAPQPEWLAAEPVQTFYDWGWRVSGPGYVIFGALAILAHARARFGRRKAFKVFLAGTLLSLSFGLLGVTSGIPFGWYEYTPLLGYRIGELVPYVIPLSWFYMVYCSLAIVTRLFQADHNEKTKSALALMAGAIFTAWDVSMDPAMSQASNHWIWQMGGFYYGMPLTNWLGWLLAGSTIARVMLYIVGATTFERKVSPSKLPLAVYAANGILPIAICARWGLTWAAILGAVAMGIPLFLAARNQIAQPAPRVRVTA